jgi:hypothetical protein
MGEFFSKLFLGFIGFGIGFLLVKYSNQIYQTFGSMDFAEKYFRMFGGTRLLIKIIGILIIFISFLYIFGVGPFSV